MVTVPREAARWFLVRRFALDSFQALPSVADAVRHLEFVQEDSISVCGRMHDLILWPRVQNYQPELLAEALYGSQPTAFEYYFPNLCALPLAEYGYFAPQMRARAAALSPEEISIAQILLTRMDSDGPLSARLAGKEHGHTVSGWGMRQTVAVRVLEKLWRQGTVSVARRDKFLRFFDRTERVYPDIHHWHAPAARLPDDTERRIFLIRKRLRARGLFSLSVTDRKALPADSVVPVAVQGVRRQYWILAEETEMLRAAENDADSPGATQLLAPLDPLVYDRQRLEDLWDFSYRWEVYVPAAQRRWGYYVLPILQKERLVGRVEPRLDRKTKTLQILSLHLESDSDRQAARQRITQFAQFLGAERVTFPT